MVTKILTTVKTRDLTDQIWREHYKYYGKSTDVKPTEGVQNAESFFEMDTGNLFLFDEEATVWLPL